MNKEKLEIHIEHNHSGLCLSAIVHDEYYHKLYMGYSVRDAKILFRQYIIEELSNIIVAKTE